MNLLAAACVLVASKQGERPSQVPTEQQLESVTGLQVPCPALPCPALPWQVHVSFPAMYTQIVHQALLMSGSRSCIQTWQFSKQTVQVLNLASCTCLPVQRAYTAPALLGNALPQFAEYTSQEVHCIQQQSHVDIGIGIGTIGRPVEWSCRRS